MAFNELLIENFGLRFQRVMLQIGVFFGRQFTAAEGAFQVAAILAGTIMGIGYAIAWTNWNTGAQVGVIVGFAILFIGTIGGLVLMVRGQLTVGVVSLGIGLILGLVLVFQGGVLVGGTLITLGGLLGVMFLMLTMAQLGVIGAETGGAAVVVDEGSRPAPGPSLEFSEHLSGDQVLWILRTISAVYATLAFMGLYASVVPVYTSLKGFLVILLALFFLMFAAFGFASTMVWLPRLQRLSMFLAVIVIVLYTVHFVALACGSSLSGIIFPFEWVYEDKDVLAYLSLYIQKYGLSDTMAVKMMTAIYWALTLSWWLFWGIIVGVFGPKLFRATGVIETSATTTSSAKPASSTGWKWVKVAVMVVIGFFVFSLMINVVLSGLAVASHLGSSSTPAPRKTNSSPVAAKNMGPYGEWGPAQRLQFDRSSWKSTNIPISVGDAFYVELDGWDGTVLVRTDKTYPGDQYGPGVRFTFYNGGQLEMQVSNVKHAPPDNVYRVVLRKEVR